MAFGGCALFLALGASGCRPIEGGPVFDSVLLRWLHPAKPSPKPVSSDEQRKADLGSMLHEMFEVVLLREPVGSGEFDSLWSPLLQGASVEGVYNGFVHSSHYQELEQKTGHATPVAVKIYFQEIAVLEAGLPHASDLSDVQPDQASLFKLKRVLGDEALKVIDAKKAKPADLAAWYGPWAARISAMKVNLGLPLRSNTDPKFHENWVLQELKQPNGMDHVVWEVLNRVHRVLNEAEERGMKK